jgi:rubrerythrin
MMPATFDDLLSAFFEEMGQTGQRYSAFVKKAQDEGYPTLTKLFRAVVASETARAKLYRTGMVAHAQEPDDLYVCPHCGLVFMHGLPEACPVDETPAGQLEKIS